MCEAKRAKNTCMMLKFFFSTDSLESFAFFRSWLLVHGQDRGRKQGDMGP